MKQIDWFKVTGFTLGAITGVMLIVALLGFGNALFNPEPDFECQGRNGIYRDYKAITVVTDDPECREGK